VAGLLRLRAIAIPLGTPAENLRVQWRLFVLQKRPGPRLRNADPRLRFQINRWFGDGSLLFVKPQRMPSWHRLVCLSVVAVARGQGGGDRHRIHQRLRPRRRLYDQNGIQTGEIGTFPRTDAKHRELIDAGGVVAN
jgi:hypothetical protein